MQCSVPFVQQNLCLQRWDNGLQRWDNGLQRWDNGLQRWDNGLQRWDNGLQRWDNGGTTVYSGGTTVYSGGTTVYRGGTTVYSGGTTVYNSGSTNSCTVSFVYRIFEYLFVLGIFDSLGFRIFVLALVYIHIVHSTCVSNRSTGITLEQTKKFVYSRWHLCSSCFHPFPL